MSLDEKLAAIRAVEMKSEAAASAFAQVLERFDKQAMAENALQPGSVMPGFELPNTQGRLVSSTELLRRGPLVVTFYRGSWCPYCMATLEALDALVPALVASETALVALAPDTGGRALEVKIKYALHYDLLTDLDNAVAMQFGVVVRLPDLYRELLQSQGIDPAAWHGNSSWFIPLPSTFVVAADGTIVHSEIHVDYTRRTEPQTLPGLLRPLHEGK